MSNLAPPRSACPAGFADAKWRKIVMQNKSFRLFAAAVRVNHLCFFNRRERCERERLRFAALKNRRTVCAWQHAYFATDRTQIRISTSINALLFLQNTDAKRLLLNVIERL